ncbi:MAG: hypothetical protein M3680_07965 [Myxococcota bacterium]|nr:hypothetical protein [Myxococcota bacterium]
MSDPNNTSALGFSPLEEAFFRAGSEAAEAERPESFEDLDEGYQPRPLWQRLFSRSSRQP